MLENPAPAPTPSSRSRIFKKLVDLAALCVAVPLAATYRAIVLLSPGRIDATFQGYSQFLSLWPGPPGDFLRRGFYRLTLADAAPDCCIQFGTTFATPEVTVGRGVYIGANCNIAHSRIGDDTLIGSYVMILAGNRQHSFDRLDIPIRHQARFHRTIHVGRDVWIGNGAIVLDDIADHAIVAAGAVVTKAVGKSEIVGGNPARVIARRGPSEG